jgi:photosystem II stability/assembly factor-like uncharacterized protein
MQRIGGFHENKFSTMSFNISRTIRPMKHYFYGAVLAFCLCTGSNSLQAQWVPTNGPYGGDVNSIVVSGTNLFAGTDGSRGGVFRSIDKGRSWAAAGMTGYGIMCLAASDSTLLAGTIVNGIFRSTDNGAHWMEVNAGIPEYTSVSTITGFGRYFYAGTSNGIFLSTDNGTSWTNIRSTLSIHAFAVSGGNFFAGSLGGGVLLSTNNGATWTEVNNGLTNKNVYSLIVSGMTLIAGTSGGIFLSTDNGTSWTNTGLNDQTVWSVVRSGTDILAGTIGNYLSSGDLVQAPGGVFRSSDNGLTWTPVNTGLTNTQVRSLTVSGTDLLAGTTYNGIYVSTVSGTSWTPANRGVTGTAIPVVSLAAAGANLFAGTSDNGIFFSNDNGESWAHIGFQKTPVPAVAVAGTNLYAGMWGGVYRSTDNGRSWTRSSSVLKSKSINALAVSGTDLFAGINNGVLRSTDSAKSWIAVDSGLSAHQVLSLAVSDTTIFAGTYGFGAYFSADNGTHWTQKNNGLIIGDGGSSLNVFTVSGANMFVGTSNGVFRSTDNGESWSGVNTGLSQVSVTSFAVSGTNLFAGTGLCNSLNGNILRSTNNGTYWTQVNTGLMNDAVYSLLINGPNIYCGTHGFGVWRRPLSEVITSIAQRTDDAPAQFRLGQNYPNPFNPSTTISFSIPSSVHVSLRIFDVIGREVATLVAEEFPAGTYTRQWNASGMTSGVYFYRLQAGSYTETKRLVLLR